MMECDDIRKMMADFLSGVLEDSRGDDLKQHVMQCPGCQREMDAHTALWDMIGEWPDEEPGRNYLPRFWSRLAQRSTWPNHFWSTVRSFHWDRRAAVVFLSMSFFIVIGFLTFRMSWQINQTETLLTALSAEEIEFVQNLELAEHFELLEQMDLLEGLDPMDGSADRGDLKRTEDVA